MTHTQRRTAYCWITVWTVLSPHVLYGREWKTAVDLYGQGVHAYFAGRASEADSLLSRALETNPDDPRMYYFRALSRLRLGRVQEAQDDMAVGAALEGTEKNRYAVGAALMRVQGSHRLMLERFRNQVRPRVGNEQLGRSQQTAARDSDALRQQVVVPLDEFFLHPEGPRALTAEELARRGDTSSRSPRPTPPPAVVPAQGFGDGGEDPFRDDVAQPPAAPAVPTVAETPPAAESTPSQPNAPSDAPVEVEEDPFSGFDS